MRSVESIKNQSSVAKEGAGAVILELEANVPDVQKILNEVRSEIDRIPSFPELAEDPEIKQITLRRSAIRVGVIGPDTDLPGAERDLRDLTEVIRDEILMLPSISQANIAGGRQYQIDVEISEKTLREYGLTLADVAGLIRRENVELPGGSMKTDSQEMLLRGKNKQLVGEQIAKIPLVTRPGGVVLTVDDLGDVRDEFDDTTAINRIDGKPGLVISVDKTASEDLLEIAEEVNEFVSARQANMPPGYSLRTWGDESINVRDRMMLLGKNGLQGLVLVLIVLAVFLELRLAFWVALGIPVSILGACAILFMTGNTMNMLSMFAFLMALGILVDDAIVIGENIYTHRKQGKDHVRAAVEGAHEVMPSVLASVATTIIAFSPLLFVPGIMGKFIEVMPFAVIAMLIISLFESILILPLPPGTRIRQRSPPSRTIHRQVLPLVAKLAGRGPMDVRGPAAGGCDRALGTRFHDSPFALSDLAFGSRVPLGQPCFGTGHPSHRDTVLHAGAEMVAAQSGHRDLDGCRGSSADGGILERRVHPIRTLSRAGRHRHRSPDYVSRWYSQPRNQRGHALSGASD